MGRSTLNPLAAVLSRLYASLGIEDRIALERLHASWSSLFGEPLASHTAPSDLAKGVLTIAVDSPSWLQQLRYLQKELLAKLAPFGIRELKLKRGRVYRAALPDRMRDDRAPLEGVTLSDDERRAVQDAVAGIGDEELKELARAAMERSLKERYRRR
jgi:hypothetical protein